MKLQEVRIKNFRSITEVTIEFAPPCKALIGINESGKTNVLHALSMLSSDKSPTVDDVREPLADEPPIKEAHVWFVFRLTGLDHLGIIKTVEKDCRLTSINDPVNTTKTKSIADLIKSTSTALYSVDLMGQRKHGSYWSRPTVEIAESWFVPKANSPPEITLKDENGTAKPLSTFKIIQGDYITDSMSPHVEPLTGKILSSIIGSAIANWVNEHLPDCFLWSYSDQQLLPPSVTFSEFASNPNKFEPLRQMFVLAGIEDVAEAISEAQQKKSGVRNMLSRVSRAATKHMRSVWKDYKGIEITVDPNGDRMDVNIKDAYNLYDFSRRSDGFKRFISFLFLVSAKSRNGELKNCLYLHDEPDVGLHPSGAKHLLDELIRVSKENYVVFSTHSIFMIDRNRIDRHYIVKKSNETTSLTVADASNFRDEEVLFNALEFSAYQIISEQNILFEGWKDKKLFEVAISSRSKDSVELRKSAESFGRCHAQGVKDISKVSTLLEMANRQWIVVSDGDKVAREQQSKYTWGDRWIRYDEAGGQENIITAEDFVASSCVLKVLKKIFVRHGINSPVPPSLSELGKLDSIKGDLRKAGIEMKLVGQILSDLKDQIFDVLKPSDIRSEYYKVMQEVVARHNAGSKQFARKQNAPASKPQI